MELNELAATAGRAIIIYIFILVVVRLMGKRTVGNFSAFDLIVAFIISEVVDEPIYGDVSLLQAFVAIGVVALLHLTNEVLSFQFPAFERLTGGQPRVLIRNGELMRKEMQAEHVSESDLLALLRENGVDDIRDVERGTLELNGMLSVIKTPEAQTLEKRDLYKVRRSSQER